MKLTVLLRRILTVAVAVAVVEVVAVVVVVEPHAAKASNLLL